MNKEICHECVGEPFLKKEILNCDRYARCSYCNNLNQILSLEVLADRMDCAFRQHFKQVTPVSPSHIDYNTKVFGWDWHRDEHRDIHVIDGIQYTACVSREAALDLQQILRSRHNDRREQESQAQSEFDDETYYRRLEVDAEEWFDEWMYLEDTIRNNTPGYRERCNRFLSKLFHEIETIRTFGNQPIVINIGPGTPHTELYRARVFDTEEELRLALRRPDLNLGPPPASLARSGRMNKAGVPVFYGATHPDTAEVEARPSVGSLVAVTKFEIVRPLKILSIGYLRLAEIIGSIFDTHFLTDRKRSAFLRVMSELLTQPVLPYQQDDEFRTTQFIAEFLEYENQPRFDGLAYFPPQVDSGSNHNVALFNSASRVEELVTFKQRSIEISSSIDVEGYYTGFVVSEFIKGKRGLVSPSSYSSNDIESNNEGDSRPISLRVLPNSIELREVTGIKLSTRSHDLKWEFNP